MDEKEVNALRKVNEAVSDYLLGLRLPEFATENGGLDALLKSMSELHEAYESEFNTVGNE